MFDYNENHSHQHHHTDVTREITKKVTVHEHRAPTDASVKLLQEMEDKARDKFIGTFYCENNSLKCEWHVFKEPMTGDCRALADFQLNGTKHRLDVRLREFEVPPRTTPFRDEKIAQLLLTRIQEQIALIITKDAFNMVMRSPYHG